MSRLTRGSLLHLPPECKAAVDRAIARDARCGAGDTHDFALSIARAVWRAGIKHGRALERADRKEQGARARRGEAMKQMWCGMKLRVATAGPYDHRLTWVVDGEDGANVGDEPGRETRPEPSGGIDLVLWLADRAAVPMATYRDRDGCQWDTNAGATKAAQAVRKALNERTW